MNQVEKIQKYKSQEYYDMVQMQLFEWLRYWVDKDPETITNADPTIQAKMIADTKKVIEYLLSSSDRVVRRVMVLAINHPTMNAIAALTANDLKTIIDGIMSNNLSYVLENENIN